MGEKFIPRKIHYFWFGGGVKSSKVKKCIESWKKFCPDYEIIEWNESNYDYKKHPVMIKLMKIRSGLLCQTTQDLTSSMNMEAFIWIPMWRS